MQSNLETFFGLKKKDIAIWKRENNLIFLNYKNFKIQNTESKFACFDLDGTLIKTKSGLKYAKNENDWEFFNSSVPGKLRNLHNRENFKIIIFTNQYGLSLDRKSEREKEFKIKIEHMLKMINIPVFLLASIKKDWNRKPCPGMWEKMQETFNLEILESKESFYVGDAAGRKPSHFKKGDHSDSDLKFALNTKLSFLTPEHFFDNSIDKDLAKHGFYLPSCSFDMASYNAWICDLTKLNGLFILLGPPCSGKSFFAADVSKRNDFIALDDCCELQKISKLLDAGYSIIVDGQHWCINERKKYVDISKLKAIPIYCLYFDYSLLFCTHLNEFKRLVGTKSFPEDFTSRFKLFSKRFEKPSVSEGFTKIFNVPFHFQQQSKNHEKIFYSILF